MSKTAPTFKDEIDFWIREEMHSLEHARRASGNRTRKSEESFKLDAIYSARKKIDEVVGFLKPEFTTPKEDVVAYLEQLEENIDHEKV